MPSRGRQIAARRRGGGGRGPARGRGRGGARRGRGRGRGQSRGNFLRPRGGQAANRAANAQANAEFNPEIRNLRQEAKGSRKRQRDLGAWYGQLAQDYAQAQQQGQEAFKSTQDTISKQLSEASERGKKQLEGLSEEDEEFAKLVGGPKDTKGLKEIAKAGAAAERSRVSLNAPTAKEGANFQAALGGYKTAARMQGIEERKGEARRRRKIKSDLTGVRREKGAARVAKKEGIRLTERDYDMQLKQLRMARREARSAEQQAAADAAIAQVEAARQARQDSLDARQDAIGSRQAQERIGVSRRNARTSERSAGRSAREGTRSAESAAKRTIQANGVPTSPREWAGMEAIVSKEEGVSPAEARRAVERLRRKMQGQVKRARKKKSASIVPYAPTPKGRRAARRAKRRGRKR